MRSETAFSGWWERTIFRAGPAMMMAVRARTTAVRARTTARTDDGKGKVKKQRKVFRTGRQFDGVAGSDWARGVFICRRYG